MYKLVSIVQCLRSNCIWLYILTAFNGPPESKASDFDILFIKTEENDKIDQDTELYFFKGASFSDNIYIYVYVYILD